MYQYKFYIEIESSKSNPAITMQVGVLHHTKIYVSNINTMVANRDRVIS